MPSRRKAMLAGLMIGIAETEEVIDHCYARNVRPDIEVIRPNQISPPTNAW